MAIRFLNGIDAEGRKIIQVGDPTNSKDAANKAYVDAHGGGLGPFLPLSGGSATGQAMTGNLHIETGGPKIYLKDTTDDDDQAIYFQNNSSTIEYVISTQDFTGAGLGDGMFIGSISNDELALVTNNSTALYINTDQNVGIGTTSPSQKLHVKGNILVEDNDSTDIVAQIGNSGDDGWVNLYANGTSTAFIGSNAVSYLNGGNVGIGTTSPNAKLHVKNNNGGFEVDVDNIVTDGVRLLAYDRDTATDRNMQYRANQHLFNISSSEKMRIDSSGNVGIGVTSPSIVGGTAKLTVNVGSGTSSPVSIVNGTTDGMYIRRYAGNGQYQIQTTSGSGNSGNLSLQSYGGNVGVGVVNPSEKLSVDGNILISDTDNNKYFGSLVNLILNADSDGNSGDTARNIIFQNRGSEKMRITADGNVGIGTTSPGFKLEVAGNAKVSSNFYIGNVDAVTTATEVLVRQSDRVRGITPANLINASGGPYLPLDGGTLSGNLTVGADTDGHDVKFFGNATGEYMLWDESDSKLRIYHTASNPAVDVFTVSAAQPTYPQMRVGRNAAEFWGVYTDDRNAHLVHRQDETTGTMTTRFDQWDSNTGDTTGEWQWRSGDGSGASMTNALVLTQAGNATFTGNISFGDSHFIGDDANDNLLIQGSASENVIIRSEDGLYFRTGGNNTRLSINSSGNVGIGTTSPTANLHVTGISSSGNLPIAKIESTGNISYLKFFNSSTGTGSSDGAYIGMNGGTAYLINKEAGNLYLGTGDDINLTLQNGGNVGIGTTSPGAKLHTIETGASEALRIDGASGGFALVVSGGSSYKTSLKNASVGNTYVSSAAPANGLIVEGSVGIGTTSPERALDIVAGNGSQFRVSSTTANNTLKNAYHQVRHYNNSEQDFVWALAQSNSSVNNLHLGGSSSLGNAATSIAFFTASNNTTTTGSQRMTISNAGNVGIGTTSPGSKLEVSSGVGANGDSILTISADTDNSTSSSSPKLLMLQKGGTKTSLIEMDSSDRTHFSNATGYYFSGGNVGIGTTSPGYKLDVDGVVRGDRFFVGTNTAASQWAFHARNNNSTADSGLYFNNNSSEIYLRNSSNVIGARIRSNSTSYFNGGDVGIGIAVPQERLHVSGETHPSIKLSSSSDGNYNVILNCGYRNEALNLSVGGYKVFTTEGFNTPETTHLYSNNSKALSLASNQAATFTSTVTATNFINSSDERLKENIEEVRDNNVEVNWKTFNFKTEKEQKRYGVIAQELEKTNPEFVREDSQGFKSVAYIDLLIAKIAELEARIQKLEK